MKKILILTMISIVVIFIIGVIVFKLSDNFGKDDKDIRRYETLEIVSQNGGHALAVDEKHGEAWTYAIFKEREYGDYEKVFSLKEYAGNSIIYWLDNKVYNFDRTGSISSYDLNSTDDNIITTIFQRNFILGDIIEVFGHKDEWIYFKSDLNDASTIFKIKADLSESVKLDKNDQVPVDIIKN